MGLWEGKRTVKCIFATSRQGDTLNHSDAVPVRFSSREFLFSSLSCSHKEVTAQLTRNEGDLGSPLFSPHFTTYHYNSPLFQVFFFFFKESSITYVFTGPVSGMPQPPVRATFHLLKGWRSTNKEARTEDCLHHLGERRTAFAAGNPEH